MAKKSDQPGVNVKDVEGAGVDVVEVVHPGADADDAFNKAQNEALMHYRLTGEVGTYIDPLRDQEPDIAPEIGVLPQADLANPVPPEGPFTGQALDKSKNPVVLSVEEKQERADEVAKVEEDAKQAAKDAAEARDESSEGADLDAEVGAGQETPRASKGDPSAKA